MTSDTSGYKITGFILIIIGILMNPWLIAWLSDLSFSETVFIAVFALSFLMISFGFGIIIRQQRFIDKVVEKYRDFAVIILNVLILFFIINIIAALLIKKPTERKPDTSYFFTPQDLFADSLEFLRGIYPGKNDQDIEDLLLLSNPYANHPVLEFQERVQESKHYNIGFEGIRFEKTVTRLNAPQKINGAIWVFGGSTTFGQGVSNNETITAFLNQLDTSNTYINFGVHAYHQSNEIDKLILLLKKGYKPRKVIFIDGLNDLIRMIETNFHPLETPALAKSAYTSDYNIATKEAKHSFLRQLPVTIWLKSFLYDDVFIPVLPWNKFDNVYDPDNYYNTDPKHHFQSTILRSPYNPVDSAGLNYVVWKLSEFYHANYRFIIKLAQAYEFEFEIYYQPQGVLSESNPFWRNQAASKQTPLYRNFEFIIPKIQEQIAAWNYPEFIDITGVLDSCPSCFVDLTHYNPELNMLVAKAILSKNQ